MVPLWTQSKAKYEVKEVISEMQRAPRHRIAVRTEAFKYIWDNQNPNQPELYNLEVDPGEKHNVSGEYPQELKELQAHIDAHLRRVAETKPADISPEPEFDDEIIRRLHDLGYIE
jgi:arylsulfatase A-like enzyme